MHELSGWIVKRLYSSQMNTAMPWDTIHQRLEAFFAARNVTSQQPIVPPPPQQPPPKAHPLPPPKPIAARSVSTTTGAAAEDDASWAADLDCGSSPAQPSTESGLTKKALANQKAMRKSEKAAAAFSNPEALASAGVEPKRKGVRVTDFFGGSQTQSQLTQSESASAKLAERVQSKLNVRRVRAALNNESRFGMRGGLLTPSPVTDSVDGDVTPTPQLTPSVPAKGPAWLRPVRTLKKPTPPPSPGVEAGASETIFEEAICEICCEDSTSHTSCCAKLLCQKCFRKSVSCPYCRQGRAKFFVV